MAKIREIAGRSGVSITTVSRVLNQSGYVKEETREAVLKAARELGYEARPTKCKSKKTGNRRDLIGVIVSEITHPFFSEVIKGIMEVAEKNKLGVVFYNTYESTELERRALDALIDLDVKGIILQPSGDEPFDAEYKAHLQTIDIPTVIIDRDVQCTDFNSVFVDSSRGCYKAIELLIQEGHRDIAIMNDPATSRSGAARLKGCIQAFEDNGLTLNQDYVFYGDFSYKSGYKMTKTILTLEKRPTAIFIMNNMMTIGCNGALLEQQVSVPEDVAVIGFDDYRMSRAINFNITAVRRHTIQMGEAAANQLLDLIAKGENAKKEPPRCIILTPTIISRGSEKFTAQS